MLSAVPGSNSKKRSEPDGASENSDDLANNDVFMAICALKENYFPAAKMSKRRRSASINSTSSEEKPVLKFIIRHVLYTYFSDRSYVDQQCEWLRLNKAIRVLSLGNEVLLCVNDDYLLYAKATLLEFEEDSLERIAVSLLVYEILPNNFNALISESAILDFGKSWPKNAKRTLPSVFLALGFTNIQREGIYGWSLPGNSGSFLLETLSGRKEILGKLNRNRDGRMREAAFLSSKLTRSSFSLDWHLRDLVGGGFVRLTETAGGRMITIGSKFRRKSTT